MSEKKEVLTAEELLARFKETQRIGKILGERIKKRNQEIRRLNRQLLEDSQRRRWFF